VALRWTVRLNDNEIVGVGVKQIFPDEQFRIALITSSIDRSNRATASATFLFNFSCRIGTVGITTQFPLCIYCPFSFVPGLFSVTRLI
jgi:hypothetical protein